MPQAQPEDSITLASSPAPGVTYQEGTFQRASYHMVKVDCAKAHVTLKPYKAGAAGDVVSRMDKAAGALATINGTFFDTAHPGKTIYGEVKADEGEYRPSMIKKRTYWAVKPDGAFEMGETVPSAKYVDGSISYGIPTEKWKSLRYVIGGGGRLIRDGRKASAGAGENDEQFQSDVLARRNRSALGFTSDGGTFWMVSCDEPGWTPQETADFFLGLGADQAMFLDGGGSTEMGVSDRIVTDLSAGSERRMPTAIVAVPAKSAGASDRGNPATLFMEDGRGDQRSL